MHDLVEALPEIDVLRDRCRAFAMLDAILCPEWEGRHYSFDARWGPGESMASMRTGGGDAWSIVFAAHGAFMRGFDHGSPMSPARNDEELWPGLLDGLPPVFDACAAEPAFSHEGRLEATVCLWRLAGDDRWRAGSAELPAGEDPDGADRLFGDLTGERYQEFAEDHYGRPLDRDAVEAVLRLIPLTDGLVRRLNPELTLADLAEDLAEIAYPG